MSVDPSTPTEAATGSLTTTGSVDSTGAATSDGTSAVHIDGGWGDFVCNIYTQNCKGDDMKCVAWGCCGESWNDNKCVMETGKKVAGDVCTVDGDYASGIDDCAKGNMCWNLNDKNEGHCVALCTGTEAAPKCDPGLVCAVANQGVLNLCLPECDPLLQDCEGTDLCIPNQDGFVCVFDASGDGGKQNDPCEFSNSCDKGLLCLDTAAASSACMQDASGCCSQFCDVSKMEPCPNPDQKCVAWFDPMMPIPPGFEDVGVCGIPA